MSEDLARRVALDPPRALGPVLATAALRSEPEDFVVVEELGFEPDGEGPHVLLRVRKRNANTPWVARELARAAGCPVRDIGYAGMKDRHAVTTQWFSVPARAAGSSSWTALTSNDFEVLEAHPHRRKLPRGALAANHFTIRLRELAGERTALRARLEQLRTRGVPNYFGPQRFGRQAANLARVARLRSLRREERGLVLSSARSVIFNAVLGARVTDGTWDRLEAGDVAILDGRGSVFSVADVDAALESRSARLEIHPSGPLWGAGREMTGGRVQALEARCADELDTFAKATVRAGLAQERRSLRVAVHDLQYDLSGDPVIAFRLARGAYATSVLREIAACRDSSPGESDGA